MDRQILLEGLGYAEGARWHDGELWFNDIKQKNVSILRGTGEREIVAEVPGGPSGLAWDKDGNAMVVSIADRRLWKLTDTGPVEIHNFGDDGVFANDMTVNDEGRAYITQYGFDWGAGEQMRGCGVIVRHPDGRVEESGSDLFYPNGIGIAQDGKSLYVAESYGQPNAKVSVFDIAGDGTLDNHRVFAEFGPSTDEQIDGLCVDSEGAAWVACCSSNEFRRVVDGGEVTDVIKLGAEAGGYTYAVDCALGGDDFRTLFLLVADTNVERLQNGLDSDARIESVRVDVPGFSAY